jgi:hypothetical protein
MIFVLFSIYILKLLLKQPFLRRICVGRIGDFSLGSLGRLSYFWMWLPVPPLSPRGGVLCCGGLLLALTPRGGRRRSDGWCGGGWGRGRKVPAWRAWPGRWLSAPRPRSVAPPCRLCGASRTPLLRLRRAFFLRGFRRLCWLIGPVQAASSLPLGFPPLTSPPVA